MRNFSGFLVATAFAALPSIALASSHREAPLITETPKVDGTDLYMFRSYEAGRKGYVTLLANYIPVQDPPGGPNFYMLDPDARYEIHVDNNGDAAADLTFRFVFRNRPQNIALQVGDDGNVKSVPIPLINSVPGGIGPGRLDRDGLNVFETYTLSLVRNNEASGAAVTNAAGGDTPREFIKPVDNIGEKSIRDYPEYARNHIYNVHIPGCENGRVFVGQRDEPFFIAVGEIFDLINLNPVGPRNSEPDDLANKNVTTLALEVPIACLKAGSDPVIGAYTTASLRQVNGPGDVTFPQKSRLGHPLVNEVVIGLPDKDRFNRSRPPGDAAAFLTYVTHPTLPELIEILFRSAGVRAPNNFPRNDLVTVFLTGIEGLNKPAILRRPGELLRLNTSIQPTARGSQSNLGVLGGDLAGFPNGRRPGDDVVDIELRVAMGVLCTLNQPAIYGCVPSDAPSGGLPYTDGVLADSTDYDGVFPYVRAPFPGSAEPNQ